MTIKSTILSLILLLIHISFYAQVPGTKKWEFSTADAITSSPAIGTDGTIYFGSYDGKLYALKPDGTKKWEYLTNSFNSSPAIGPDGTIYIGSADNKLYAIKSDGSKKWEFVTGGAITSSPAVGLDGAIYFGSADYKIYAINPDGTLRWEFSTSNSISSSPSIGLDGTIYIGSDDNKLRAINTDGTLKWLFDTGIYVDSSPSVGKDGIIYIGLATKMLYAINPEGTKNWDFTTTGNIYTSPVIDFKGIIYVGSNDNKLYAVNTDGTKKWEYVAGGIIYSTPAIGADGTVFFGSNDAKLYAINTDGTKKWEYVAGGNITSSPAIGTDGTIYFGTQDKKLYAVYSDCGGLASGIWPKFRKNYLNNGNCSTGIYPDNHFFAFLSDSETESIEPKFNKLHGMNLRINSIVFSNPIFKNALSMPFITNPYSTDFKMPFTLSAKKTGLYTSYYNIDYNINNYNYTYYDSIEVAVIKDENSEISIVGKRAIDSYYTSLDSNLIAVYNNLGVIYRQVGEYNKAEEQFNNAVNLALNNFYGFTGIKMNQGVVKSDKLNSTNAMSIYSNALGDLTAADSSVLTPQLYYNQAWEHYRLKAFSDSKAKALLTINHKKTNSFLRAKAWVLLGADDAALKDTLAAISGFQNAIDIDPSSCIAEIARENIRLLTTTDIFPVRSDSFITYPNPSSGDFQILLRDNGTWPIMIRIYNQTGIMVHEKEYYGPQNVIRIQLPGIPKGIYFIEKESGGRKTLNKIVII